MYSHNYTWTPYCQKLNARTTQKQLTDTNKPQTNLSTRQETHLILNIQYTYIISTSTRTHPHIHTHVYLNTCANHMTSSCIYIYESLTSTSSRSQLVLNTSHYMLSRLRSTINAGVNIVTYKWNSKCICAFLLSIIGM